MVSFAVVCVSYSTFLAFYYAHQPPLDVHAFRQSQTALTAYWIIQDGFKLAYWRGPRVLYRYPRENFGSRLAERPIPCQGNIERSRVFENDFRRFSMGDYVVGVARAQADELEVCQLEKHLVLASTIKAAILVQCSATSVQFTGRPRGAVFMIGR
jgi:hypothetical protein